MKRKCLLCAIALLATNGLAATLTGTVTNASTGKPSSGDDVALLSLSQGMTEQSHTKTDSKGSFSFNISDSDQPHLVRVTHDGVTYFPQSGPIRPGTNTVEISVYDAARNLAGVSTNVDVLRIQADNGQLQILELVAVKNDSKPPRTLAGDRTYEVFLPAGAHLDQTVVQGPGGMPISTTATPDGNSGKHYFNYALKPGETRFEIAYHLPYTGDLTITPKVANTMQHFVVMMPKSMTFSPKNASDFAPMTEDPSATVQVASNVKPGSDLTFRISGTGLLPDEQQAQQQQQAAAGPAANDNRPGGGLGVPIDAPDPLHQHRWLILSGLAVVMVAGAIFVVNRSKQNGTTTQVPVSTAIPVTAKPISPKPAAPLDRSAMLLEGLKEELFQLEVEKQQGHISPEEYESARAALDQTLKRALARKNA